ncbi:MAG: S-methyl-5-thioribose-1-phosphate isomerase [Candidatus Omnitrophica bacterium]|nr:S-methyl-5-thioribose-1-phosphate isomerase [Candidatus Omnitrophota bacterium]
MKKNSHLQTIEWKNNKIRIIDQTRLPKGLVYLDIDNLRDLWLAIRELKVRGAPALGAAAALGVYLGSKNLKTKSREVFNKELFRIADYLASSRPTARNLFWGIERMCGVAEKFKGRSVEEIKRLLFKEAQAVIKEDKVTCRKIGLWGARLIKDNSTVLTICNAGILATIDYGTALGVLYRCKEEGKRLKVYACETRPLLQGARLTTWELQNKGIDVTLICDNMAASLMQQGKIDLVITGADRIAVNGDTANKIGTLGLAILCRYHKIPFYIAAPSSTFDLSIKSGRGILIEQRKPEEVTSLFSKITIAPKGVRVFNPAFDVTPNNLISAIITEKGIIRPSFRANIRKIISSVQRRAYSG